MDMGIGGGAYDEATIVEVEDEREFYASGWTDGFVESQPCFVSGVEGEVLGEDGLVWRGVVSLGCDGRGGVEPGDSVVVWVVDETVVFVKLHGGWVGLYREEK